MQSRTKTTRDISDKKPETAGKTPCLVGPNQATAENAHKKRASQSGGDATDLSNPLARPRQIVTTGIVPPQWRCILKEILITERQLRRRVAELGRAIMRDYVGKEPVVVAVLSGSVMFLADLLRHLRLPLRLDFIGVSTYRSGTTSGRLVYTKELQLDVKGNDVLLVDDILDTGQTLVAVQKRILQQSPKSLRTCVLMDKPARHKCQVKVDYVGFVIPDIFVVGYGLDYAERYRNLPFIGTLRPEQL